MEKRSLLAIVLSALVFVIYYSFFFEMPTPPQKSSPPPSSESQPLKLGGESQPQKASVAPPPLIKPAELPPPQISTLENDLYRVEQSNQGGTLHSFQVKGYREGIDKKSPWIDLFSGTPEKSLLLQFHQSNFELPPLLAYEIKDQGKDFIEYQWKSSELALTYYIRWSSENYVADIRVELENHSQRSLETALGLRVETLQHPEQKSTFSFLKGPQNFKYPATYGEKGVTRHQDVGKLPLQTEEKGPYQWAALEDRYFLWAIVLRALSSENRVEYGVKENRILHSTFIYPKEVIAPSGRLKKEFTLYLGPKEIEHLKAVGVHLEEAVDYGWFSFVAHPILFLLKFFHRWVGNWGIAIILLTLFIKLILHPINKRSMDSMKAMQKLQPRLAELREKYKNDRERLNMEMMNLFKTYKVNPMGGCLPMLLQMPVYIALYNVLYNAIELYHAPFFGFYKDLSAPDPYFVSPILLGIFMVLQQRMTPSTQDPAQAKVMLMMPIVFSAFMLFLPSGLVIYIFVNTLITVVQQYLHQHDMSLADLIRRLRKAT